MGQNRFRVRIRVRNRVRVKAMMRRAWDGSQCLTFGTFKLGTAWILRGFKA